MTATATMRQSTMGLSGSDEPIYNTYDNSLYEESIYEESKAGKKKSGSVWKILLAIIAGIGIIFIAGVIATILIVKLVIDLLVPIVGPIVGGVVIGFLMLLGFFMLLIIKIIIPFI